MSYNICGGVLSSVLPRTSSSTSLGFLLAKLPGTFYGIDRIWSTKNTRQSITKLLHAYWQIYGSRTRTKCKTHEQSAIDCQVFVFNVFTIIHGFGFICLPYRIKRQFSQSQRTHYLICVIRRDRRFLCSVIKSLLVFSIQRSPSQSDMH